MTKTKNESEKVAKAKAALDAAQATLDAARDAYSKAKGDGDIQAMGDAEAAARRAAEQVSVLKRVYDTVVQTQTPAPTPEAETFVAAIRHYRDAWTARRDKVQAELADVTDRLAQLDSEIDRATQTGDVDAVCTLMSERQTLAPRHAYIQELLSRAEAAPVYDDPRAAHDEAWAAVDAVLQPMWDRAIQAAELARDAYVAAVAYASEVKYRVYQARDVIEAETGVESNHYWDAYGQTAHGVNVAHRAVTQGAQLGEWRPYRY